MFERFTDKAIAVIMLAQEECRRSKHKLVGTEQLLLGLIGEGGTIAAEVLKEFGLTLAHTRKEVEKITGVGTGFVPIEIPFTPLVKRVFERSIDEAQQLSHRAIGPEHILLSLIQDTEGVASQVLQDLEIDPAQVRAQVIRAIGDAATVPAGGSRGHQSQGVQGKALLEFGSDLTQLAMEGKIDPVVGRQQEIERVIQILGRRTKNNPVLIGEPGVGKTAIAEGLAQRIVNQNIPPLLADKRVFSLDLGQLVAGTRLRGEFEERLTQIVAEVRQAGNIILVIDEVHTLVGSGAIEGGQDAANLLKPALARGDLQCVGATTLDEYRQYIERDAALERRFQPVMVEEPSVEDTIEILEGLRARYEEHHKLTISDEALKVAAVFSDRYISDRYLPDKAIDLIDEAGSRLRLQLSMRPGNPRPALVEGEDIAQVASAWTGIPVSRLTESETIQLINLEETLHQRIVGQSEAVTAVSRAMRRSRVRLSNTSRPLASLLFCGPTGVGKTELTKALAATLFGAEDALVRLDMSEYMESQSIAKLIGSPPGYVGYGEGGQLTEAVRRRPYTVLLLDEIEKAHPDIFNLLLQLLEDGRLTDSQGRVVDFKHTLVIMTSNLGSSALEKQGASLGFLLDDDANEATAQFKRMQAQVNEAIKQSFRPEFINRLDETIVFRQLTRDEVKQIAAILLQDITSRLQEQNLNLKVTERFKDHLVTAGYDPTYGARPLRRALSRLVEDNLAEAILASQLQSGDTAVFDIDDDGQVQVYPQPLSVLTGTASSV